MVHVWKLVAALMVLSPAGRGSADSPDVPGVVANAGFDMGDLIAGSVTYPDSPLSRRESSQPADETRVRRGLVFLEDVYMASPYGVVADKEGMAINGVPVKFGMAAEVKDPAKRAASFARSAEHLTRLLNASSVVVITSDGTLDVLNKPHMQLEFLHRLARHPASGETHAQLPQIWRDRADSIEPTSTLQRIVESRIEAMGNLVQVVQRNREQSTAAMRLNDAAYPLTVFGMVVCVFSMGHLLQTAPRIQTEEQRMETSDQWTRAASISVVLFVVMALLDLTWTLLASGAGQIHELNPIGGALMSRPFELIGLKVGATVVSAGILISLRSKPTAQKAAWWVCLLCTLLTMRWLVFHSLFVN